MSRITCLALLMSPTCAARSMMLAIALRRSSPSSAEGSWLAATAIRYLDFSGMSLEALQGENDKWLSRGAGVARRAP